MGWSHEGGCVGALPELPLLVAEELSPLEAAAARAAVAYWEAWGVPALATFGGRPNLLDRRAWVGAVAYWEAVEDGAGAAGKWEARLEVGPLAVLGCGAVDHNRCTRASWDLLIVGTIGATARAGATCMDKWLSLEISLCSAGAADAVNAGATVFNF